MKFHPFHLLLVILVITAAGCVHPKASARIQVFSLRPGTLPKLKARVDAGDPALQPALKQLLAEADAMLESKPRSVMEKPHPPASGDKHDYLSVGPYWWPDPAKPDGLPYIRQDGKHNPDRQRIDYDRPRLNHAVDGSYTLALAYYLTGRDAYAEHAGRLLRVFFLDPATRMNPNMNHAQGIPGRNDGRGAGMIETARLPLAADAVLLLEGSPAWSRADRQGMKAWFNAFVNWALTSKNGKEERAAKNNHGTYYDVQVAHLALHLGRNQLAREILEGAKKKRLDVQLAADGGQPLELEREDSFGYSRANLRGLFLLGTLAEHLGVDLWHYQTPNGAGIRRALDFLLPYVEQPDKPWPYERSVKPDRQRASEVLLYGYSVYRDERYLAAWRKIPGHEQERDTLWFFGN